MTGCRKSGAAVGFALFPPSKMRDVRKQIDGPGGVTLAALWYYFIR